MRAALAVAAVCLGAVSTGAGVGGHRSEGRQAVGAENAIVRENRIKGAQRWGELFDSATLRRLLTPPNEDAPATKSIADSGGFPGGNPADPSYVFTTVHYNSNNSTVGYAGKDSYNLGETLDLHVSSTAPGYGLELFRIGWYCQGIHRSWRSPRLSMVLMKRVKTILVSAARCSQHIWRVFLRHLYIHGK